MKITSRPKVARLTSKTVDEGQGQRRVVVEVENAGTVAVRLHGRRTRRVYDADALYIGRLVTPQLTLTSEVKTEFRGKRRLLVADFDAKTGSITVRPYGIKKGKTYNLADLFRWGPQLQLL